MSAKHTPGKWYADLDGECVNVRHEDGGLIAQCTFLRGPHGCGGRRSTEEVAANARLIAAAPDILEALRKADDLLGFHEWSAKPEFEGARPTVRINGEDHAELLAVLRAAIAKAEGRT